MRRLRFPLRLLCALAVIAVPVAAYWGLAAVVQRNDLKKTLSFKGLTRSEVYARLRSFGVTATTWADSSDKYLVSTDPYMGVDTWPQMGDAEVNFRHVEVDGPPGVCGANARIILRFVDDRVTKVEQGKTLYACL
jgi:hypothetical protein